MREKLSFKQLKEELQELNETIAVDDNYAIEDNTLLEQAIALLAEMADKEQELQQSRCKVCQGLGNVVEVTAKFTGIKQMVCPNCYLKLKNTGLIEVRNEKSY